MTSGRGKPAKAPRAPKGKAKGAKTGSRKPAPTKPPKPARPPTQMDLAHAFKRRDWDPDWLARFGSICLSFPEAEEAEQFGGPWYKVGGKSFACYGAESEKAGNGHRGVDGASLNLTLMEQAALLEDPRFTRTRYVGQHGWVTTRWDGEPDWDEVRELVESAYRKAAKKRHLQALDRQAMAAEATGERTSRASNGRMAR
jgi:predicted DNA-binding protein (MmcQ/YjbR family)